MTAQPWEPRLGRLEGAYEQVDKRLDSIDRRLEGLDKKIEGVRDLLQWRMTSLILGSWVTLMIAIFFHHGQPATNVIIRPATADDAEPIASILRRAFAEYQRQYTPQAYATTTQPDIFRRLSEGEIWIATRDGAAVGTVSACVEHRSVHLRGMAIVPEARGLGIADALLRQVEQFARAHGLRCLRLQTTPFLLRAIRCYERFGFVRSEHPSSELFGTPLFAMEKQLDGD